MEDIEQGPLAGSRWAALAVFSAVAIAFLVGSFSYEESAVRVMRFAGVAALGLMGIEFWNEWKAGRVYFKVPPTNTPSIHSVTLLMAVTIVVSFVLAWVTDIRWGSVAFAGLVPLLLVKGRTRFVVAGIGPAIVYLIIYGLERTYLPLWS
jgi:hypothetical protein